MTGLAGEAATRDAVLRALPSADVVHPASHAAANPDDPLRSGFLLADDGWVQLSDLLAMQLRARLVVLSSCESALPGTRLPDEVVSLPSGLMAAGVAGVLGSLWLVEDTPTAVLMAEMWRRVCTGVPALEASCGAQRWMRDASRQEVVRWASTPLVPPSLRELVTRWLHDHPDDAPFSRPRLWGAFTYTGG